ncbi:hypothetical protein GWI33_006817 [Rhynchophorus ferrugineus]|uniref:Uncharacterized protein n=1 Tax=Rhynchophorus ferrugineus TaxID=354439 RepID=A0A834IIF3_RHYFE|nr:hypothetical protein GWI33_006817 [Rhynchophorus ferrugineus]
MLKQLSDEYFNNKRLLAEYCDSVATETLFVYTSMQFVAEGPPRRPWRPRRRRRRSIATSSASAAQNLSAPGARNCTHKQRDTRPLREKEHLAGLHDLRCS